MTVWAYRLGRVLLSAALLASALAAQAAAQAARREVAVTFDDLPAPQGDLEDMRRITSRLLESVKRNGVPAVGFVNEGKLYRRGETDARTELLRAWLDAGLELGNHTFSHLNLQRAPLEEYKDDVLRGETVTRMLLRERGLRLRYFRHPFLFTGTTPEYKKGLAEFLAARGYAVAPVTIDNADYIFADVYLRAKKRGDAETAKRVADAYVPYMESAFEHFERLSSETFGREIKHVLLLHANEINADRFDELAAMMKRRGYTFVTLEEALKDPAYLEPDALYKNGISWLHRWRMAKGLPVKWEPEVPKFLGELYKAGRSGN
ncbi:MAG: polysaccharide deacetylase family protein [Acidobacteria bacterium]|nr:polysaccharide deacetylase family protein [Acidobacteriota bacterium]MCA1621248.1 polysaccharide deacetylase family protein [Acidobacteriota bacterium]